MNELQIIESERRLMANVYSKRPVVAVRARGAILWDVNGKEYIDCMTGYGVSAIGHCHPRVVEAIKQQAERLITCHSSLYNDARSELLEEIVKIAPKGLSRVFLSNSGTEAVECAIKLSRRFTGKPGIIAMRGAFHGKTFGALSATWDKKYRAPFEPLVPGFIHVPYGNAERVRQAINEKTGAVIVEPIQGEGGVRLPPNSFLKELREICNEKGILLIFDEVQTGFGRTGRMFACEHWNVKPDIICLAKAAAGGLPIGLTIARDDVMSSLKTGEHSTTFGGGPLVCAAATAAIKVLIEERLAERAVDLGRYMRECLDALREKYRIVREVRGLGLMIGVELRFDVLNIILKSIDRGVLMLDAGRNVLRFLPPLVITPGQIDRVIEILDITLGEEESARLLNSSFAQNA